MSPNSWAPADRTAEAERPRLQPEGLSFIGLGASHPKAEATWLAPVIRELLGRHERVLLLIESELELYERYADLKSDATVLQPAAESDAVTAQTMAQWRHIDAMRRALPAVLLPRVQIASWAHFIDASFASLWRHLLTAFAVDTRFRHDVLELGQLTMRQWRGHDAAPQVARLACLSHVESLAMRLRVGEIAGYHHEYGCGSDALLVERLYAGTYATDGLTVESLVGHTAHREYRIA